MGSGSALFCYIVLFNLVEKVFVSLFNYLRNELFPIVLFEQKTLSYLRLSPYHTILKNRYLQIKLKSNATSLILVTLSQLMKVSFSLTVLVDSDPPRSNKITFLNYCLKMTLNSIS